MLYVVARSHLEEVINRIAHHVAGHLHALILPLKFSHDVHQGGHVHLLVHGSHCLHVMRHISSSRGMSAHHKACWHASFGLKRHDLHFRGDRDIFDDVGVHGDCARHADSAGTLDMVQLLARCCHQTSPGLTFVAPFIASAMAWVDFRVAILRDTACSWDLRPYILVTAWRFLTRDFAMTLTASCWQAPPVGLGLCVQV